MWVFILKTCVCVLMEHKLRECHGPHLSHFCHTHVPSRPQARELGSRPAVAEYAEDGVDSWGQGLVELVVTGRKRGLSSARGRSGQKSNTAMLLQPSFLLWGLCRFFQNSTEPRNTTRAGQGLGGQVTHHLPRPHMRKRSPKDGKDWPRGPPALVSFWVPVEDSARARLSALMPDLTSGR